MNSLISGMCEISASIACSCFFMVSNSDLGGRVGVLDINLGILDGVGVASGNTWVSSTWERVLGDELWLFGLIGLLGAVVITRVSSSVPWVSSWLCRWLLTAIVTGASSSSLGTSLTISMLELIVVSVSSSTVDLSGSSNSVS